MVKRKNNTKCGLVAFSMIEILVSLSILTVLTLAISISIAKKTAAKLGSGAAAPKGAEYACYKDMQGNLWQKSLIKYKDGTVSTGPKQVESCNFQIADEEKANSATVYVIGGGGGGAAAFYDIQYVNFSKQVNSNEIIKNSNGDYYCDSSGECYAEYYENSNDTPQQLTTDKEGNSGAKVVKSPKYPGDAKITNLLSDYISDSLYNTTLRSYLIRLGAGSTGNENSKVFKINPEVNKTYVLVSGQDATEKDNVHISPSPTILNYNGAEYKVEYKKCWEEKPDWHKFCDTKGPIYSGIVTTGISADGRKVQSITLKYGNNGKAGQTEELKNQKLRNAQITINADNIGNGGCGGAVRGETNTQCATNNYNQEAGENGGNTIYNYNGKEKTAAGGQGGAQVIINPVVSGGRFTTDATTAATGLATANINGAISKYVQTIESKYFDTSVLEKFYAKSSKCTVSVGAGGVNGKNDIISDCVHTIPCQDADFGCYSYGAGGSGMSAMLKYSYIDQLKLSHNYSDGTKRYIVPINCVQNDGRICVIVTDVTDNSKTMTQNPVPYYPNTNNDIGKNNGMGGAIIIKWGEDIVDR